MSARTRRSRPARCGATTAAASRGVDLVSRIGGDEFVILLRNTTSEVQAISLRITTALARPILTSGEPATIGVTTGSAIADRDADELIERADHAMYLAKANEQTHRTTRDRPQTGDARCSVARSVARSVRPRGPAAVVLSDHAKAHVSRRRGHQCVGAFQRD